MFEYAALQVGLELPRHGQATGIFCPLPELGPVLLDDLVQQALFWPMPNIAIGAGNLEIPGRGDQRREAQNKGKQGPSRAPRRENV